MPNNLILNQISLVVGNNQQQTEKPPVLRRKIETNRRLGRQACGQVP